MLNNFIVDKTLYYFAKNQHLGSFDFNLKHCVLVSFYWSALHVIDFNNLLWLPIQVKY